MQFTMHMVVVDHVRCAEHDAWVHVDKDGHAHKKHAYNDDNEVTSSKVHLTKQNQGDHDHCQLVWERRDELTGLHASVAESRTHDSAVMSWYVQCRFVDWQKAYGFAPKSSPPAIV